MSGPPSTPTPSDGRKRVSRDVEPSALRALLEHPRRATVAVVDRERAEVLPARYRLNGDVHTVGIAVDTAAAVDGREVVLVIDDGEYWFELRGVSVRGVATRTDPPVDEPQWAWFAIAPRRVLAWDYATIREA